RLDIRGRIKVLHGQNRKTEEPPLALFALCTPFGPPSLLEIPHKEVMFKSKHKLDLTLVSMDQRGKMLLGYSDAELADMGGYDLVHYDDLAYVASAHQELLKTGASGMIAYRYQSKEGQWQWLQTSSRLVYKNSKPDFVISTHRPLMEEEGRDLLGKRTMDFKVSYLDAGLTNSYFSDSEMIGTASQGSASQPSTPQRVNRRYKTTKRKLSNSHQAANNAGQLQAQPPPEYLVPADPAAAVAAAYTNLNVYGGSYPAAGPTTDTYMTHSGNFHQTLYDNRFLASTTENLFHQYRPLPPYYGDYHTPTAPYPDSNGFIDVSPRTTSCLPVYEAQVHQLAKFVDNTRYNKCLEVGPYLGGVLAVEPAKKGAKSSGDNLSSSNSAASSPAAVAVNGLVTPKMEEMKEVHPHRQQHYSPPQQPRQTVLMWGTSARSPQGDSPGPQVPAPPAPDPYQDKKFGDPLKSLAEMNSLAEGDKWKPETPPHVPSPKYGHYQYSEHGQEVWPHQIYPYHQ
ncbi:hypothetical protein AAG570_011642, partial [Ranatra chinensis]